MPAQQHTEVLQAEPGDVESGFDFLLTEGFEQERFPGAGWSAHDQVLPAPDPFQGTQGVLGERRDGGQFGLPGVERLPGREPGRRTPGRQGRSGPGLLLPRRTAPSTLLLGPSVGF